MAHGGYNCRLRGSSRWVIPKPSRQGGDCRRLGLAAASVPAPYAAEKRPVADREGAWGQA
jgi:hypothetical protein